MKRFLKNQWPLMAFLIIEVMVFLTNYTTGTYLIGWDNVLPELNFKENILSQLFGVWQYSKGVGFLDGMATTANIPHTIFIFLLSILLPQSVLRYTFIFLMHLLGIIGMYQLLKRLLNNTFSAILGALFYGFNLATIQMFYAPLEAFAIHFAALPILTLSLITYLETPSRKHLFFFTLVSLLTIPQGFVPQLFISYLLLVATILSMYLLVYRRYGLKTVRAVLLTIFCVNAYWLLPYIYSIPQNAPVIINSKINQMASNHIYLLNHMRGTLADVMILRGFMLDTVEYVRTGTLDYIMQVWRDYSISPFFIIPALLFAIMAILGGFFIFKERRKGFYPFVFVFLITGFFLGNNIVGLSLLNTVLRFLFPVFNEAFRFPFTKFVTLFSFCYSILATCGMQTYMRWLTRVGTQYPAPIRMRTSDEISKWQDTQFWKNRVFILFTSRIFTYVLITTFLLSYCFPSFQGHFLFDALRLQLKPEYLQTIEFFQKQNPTERIATLPQPSFWNWEYHTDNFRGSGFLWYGIKQPMMERSFDPWSSENENYYWELSQAITSDNPIQLKNVLKKYQITWVLLNKDITFPSSPKSVMLPEIIDMLQKIGVQKKESFGPITVFKILDSQPALFSDTNLPRVNSYTWGNNDVFYRLHGDYITSATPDFILPFRSLFTTHTTSPADFTVTEFPKKITFQTLIPGTVTHLTLPSYTEQEAILPATLVLDRDQQNNATISAHVSSPDIVIAGIKLSGQTISYRLFSLPKNPAFPLNIKANGIASFTLNNTDEQTLGTTFVTLKQNNVFTITDAQKGAATQKVTSEELINTFSKPSSIVLQTDGKPLLFSVTVPKIVDNYLSFEPSLASTSVSNCNTTTTQGSIQNTRNGDSISLAASYADACLSFYDPHLATSLSYLVSLQSQHHTGESLSFWAEDTSHSYTFSQVTIPQNQKPSTTYFVLPPMQNNNNGYSLHIDNLATGTDTTSNTLSHLSLSPIPYNYLSTIMLDTSVHQESVQRKPVSFTYKNPSLFIADQVSPENNQTLILSTAYNPGWAAFQFNHRPTIFDQIFPFFSGKQLIDHVKVNNWENGWQLPFQSSITLSQSSIVIVFLPQYVEYIGFVLFFLYFPVLFFLKI